MIKSISPFSLNNIKEWQMEKRPRRKIVYTIEPHVVELITEYNDDYEEGDTPKNENREEHNRIYTSFIILKP